MSGFFSNENQFQNDPNVSQRDKLTGFYGNAVRPAYIEDLVKKAEEAAVKSEQFRDEAEDFRDDAQAILNNTTNVYNDTVVVYNDTIGIKNNTQGIYDDTVIIKDDTQTIYDSAIADTTQIYNNTLDVYDNTIVIENEVVGYRNEAEIFRDEAEAAAIATANGVVNKGHWDASTGNFPTPTINPVEKADWYRISTGGTMSDGVQNDITVNAGDNLYWDTYNDVWYAIENDNASWQKFTRGEAELNQMREQNSNQFAASGFVHFGEHIAEGAASWEFVNEGLWVPKEESISGSYVPDSVYLGRDPNSTGNAGTSKTRFPVTHIAGFISELVGNNLNTTSGLEFGIRFPEAPDGTVTFNTSTGEVIQHPDSAAAFALESSDPDVEVVINRVDMFGFEFFLEEVSQTNPYVYPNGCIQSQATTMNGIATVSSNRPDTYYAVYEGDTSSRGLGVDFYALTHSQKKTVVSDKSNNIFILNDGRLVQWRVRQRTIAGAGNGDWSEIDCANNLYARFDTSGRLQPQGILNSQSSLGNHTDIDGGTYLGTDDRYNGGVVKSTLGNNTGVFVAAEWVGQYGITDLYAVDGECYFLVCGVVPRLNQGAYHPSLNPMGAGSFSDSTDGISINQSRKWYMSFNTSTLLPLSVKDCFSVVDYLANVSSPGVYATSTGYLTGSRSSNISGRPDSKFYDAIYSSGQGGVIDYRMSAWDMGSKEEASKVFQKVVNGSYRGEEKLCFTKATSMVPPDGAGTRTTIYISADNVASEITIGSYVGGTVGAGIVTRAAFVNGKGTYVITDGSFTVTASAYDICYTVNTPIPVSGDFTQIDVIGDPAEILATPQLANGWVGSWAGIGNPQAINNKLSRKALSTSSYGGAYTTTNGSSWAASNPSITEITNNIASGLSYTSVYVYPYTAFAKQTKPSVNKPVFNGSAGLGDVWASSAEDVKSGVLLQESLSGKVGVNQTHGKYQRYALSTSTLNGDAKFEPYQGKYLPSHTPIDLAAPANNSPAVKALWYQTSDNQQAGLDFAYNELVYNAGGTVGNEWGDTTSATTYSNAYGQIRIVDGVSTYTNLNGDVCLCGTNELSIPFGYTKNQARAGEQTIGVDL